MNQLLALKLPGDYNVQAPNDIPTLDNTSVGHIIGFFLSIIIFAGIVGALVFIIYAGFRWISSGGDKQKLDQARKTVVFAIVGLILMVIALVAVNFIGTILGVRYF